MYKHSELNNEHIALHDCCANKIIYENGVLSFVFPDGFWVTPEHLENDFYKIISTDSARLDYKLLFNDSEDVRIYIFRENSSGEIIREEWEPEKFINEVNSGTFQLVFITEYKTCQAILHKCFVYLNNEQYRYECEIIIDTDSATYNWNQLRYDCEW